MRAKTILTLSACLGVSLLTACVSTVDGRTKAGVPFGRDKVESMYDRPAAEVIVATKDVLTNHGTLTSEDVVRATFGANVDERYVWVKIESVDPKLTKVTTQCRGKGGGADSELAAYLDKQIAVRLAAGTLRPSKPPVK